MCKVLFAFAARREKLYVHSSFVWWNFNSLGMLCVSRQGISRGDIEFLISPLWLLMLQPISALASDFDALTVFHSLSRTHRAIFTFGFDIFLGRRLCGSVNCLLIWLAMFVDGDFCVCLALWRLIRFRFRVRFRWGWKWLWRLSVKVGGEVGGGFEDGAVGSCWNSLVFEECLEGGLPSFQWIAAVFWEYEYFCWASKLQTKEFRLLHIKFYHSSTHFYFLIQFSIPVASYRSSSSQLTSKPRDILNTSINCSLHTHPPYDSLSFSSCVTFLLTTAVI
jgi:hypothetical protein